MKKDLKNDTHPDTCRKKLDDAVLFKDHGVLWLQLQLDH